MEIAERIEIPLIFAVDPVTEETYPENVKEICSISIHLHLGTVLRGLSGVKIDPEFKEHLLGELIKNVNKN